MLPRRRSTPSIRRSAPPAVTAPAKRSAAIRGFAPGSAGTISAERRFTGSLTSCPSSASAPTGSPSTAKKPPLTPATAPVLRAMSLGRSSPATRSFERTPLSRPASAPRSTLTTLTRQGPPSRTIDVQRTPGATTALSRRSSSEREPSGSSAATADAGARAASRVSSVPAERRMRRRFADPRRSSRRLARQREAHGAAVAVAVDGTGVRRVRRSCGRAPRAHGSRRRSRPPG